MPAQSSAPFDVPVPSAFLPSAFGRAPDDVRQASEKMLNVWVGAVTPLWAPFFAATSLGIGAWAMMQAMQRNQTLFKDVSFGGLWEAGERMTEALLGTTDTTPVAVVKAASDAMEARSESTVAMAKAATTVMNQTIGMATRTIETATQNAAREVAEASKPLKVEVSAKLAEESVANLTPEAGMVIPVAKAASQTLAPKPPSRRRPARKA